MTREQAKAALQRFHRTYPQLSTWKRQQIGLAQQYRQVRTRLGLIRDFAIQGEGYLQGEACNIPIQGSAAEVLMCTLNHLPGTAGDAARAQTAPIRPRTTGFGVADMSDDDDDIGSGPGSALVSRYNRLPLPLWPRAECRYPGCKEITA